MKELTNRLYYRYKNLSKKAARLRRKHGILSEKKLTTVLHNKRLDAGETLDLHLKGTKQRAYLLWVTLSTRSQLHTCITHGATTHDFQHSSTKIRIPFYLAEDDQYLISFTNQSETDIRIRSAEIFVTSYSDPLSSHIKHLFDKGHLYQIADTYGHHTKHPTVRDCKSLIELLENPLATQPTSISTTHSGAPHYLYLLHASIIFNMSGYSTRSHSILKHLPAYAQTRLDYPKVAGNQITHNAELIESHPDELVHDDIPYHFHSSSTSPSDTQNYIQRSVESLVEQHKNNPPAAVIATSNYINGYVGYHTAKTLGRPFAYEMRGLWHLTKIVDSPYWEDSDQFKLAQKAELELAALADQVFVLSPAMKEWLVEHKVAAERIEIAPNGIEPDRFTPSPKSTELLNQLKLQGSFVFGFIGSIVEYEGLDLLISAFLKFNTHTPNSHLLIVGDGKVRPAVEALANTHPNIIFTGRVPFDQVNAYYSVCDVMVYPRTGEKVCELVPPIKPIEAMACKKLVLCSDVAPMRHYLNNEQNGLLFQKDNHDDLLRVMNRAYKDFDRLAETREAGYHYAMQNHLWHQTAKTIDFLKLTSNSPNTI